MKEIDRVMEQIKDSKWHGIEEMKQNNISEKNLTKRINFLAEQGLIIIKNEKIKITQKGLMFLELPV
ncbi:MAG: winged helix-turn-helix domain-containing protein [Candidatus Methanoperedens sp.]|nr:winged helix-turn-helix domain-containing protein [Candidatus Methanoperedens sp.]